MSQLIAELQRRNVFRVVAAYALVAWIIIEAGSVLLPTFGASETAFQTYVMVVVVGFIIALLAWIFEITPQGVQLDGDVVRTEEQAAKSKRIMNFSIIGLLIIALFVSITFNVSDLSAESTEARSIAVLPFTSRSIDPENSLFADGIHDDLLTKLANTGALKVISRTSVLEYRDTTKNLRQIGDELGVDTLLEGAVQKVGDNVRINVQLIDAQTDKHLWAETYDRKLTMQNIFSIQSEISQSITTALRSTLIADDQGVAVQIPTDDIRAYSLYVSGRDNLYLRRLETTQEARSQFEQAIQLDPEYAEAYVGLAESILLLHINHRAVPRDEAYLLAQDNLDIALSLNSELASAYATLGLLKTNAWTQTRVGDENLEAEAAYERAISLNPNDAQAYMWFASLRASEQRIEDAIAFYHKSQQLDPLGRIPLSNLPSLYAELGQNDVALKLWRDAIEIHPEWPTPYEYVAVHLLGLGRLDEALAWSATARNLGDDPNLGKNIDFGIYMEFGERERVREMLDAVPADHFIAPFVEGFQSLFDGDYKAALEFFTNIIDTGPQEYLKFVLPTTVDVALLADDLTSAKKYLFLQEPLLDTDGDLPIDSRTVRNVVKLAYIDKKTGDLERAGQLLRAALAVVREMPRLGMSGHGILDAQIYVLLDRREDAFLALSNAVEEGYRSSAFFDNWILEIDPYLQPLHADPRFTAIVQQLKDLNEVMHQRAIEAERSGNWSQLTEAVLTEI